MQPSLFPQSPQRSAPALKALALCEQPAYRVTYHAGACLGSELLAAIIGGPQQIELAHALTDRFGGIHAVARADVADLTQVAGIGAATAARLKAALELSRRLMQADANERPQISSPADAANLLAPRMSHLEQEHVLVLTLDTRNRVIGEPVDVYHGSLNTSMIRVGELFREAIRRNAAGIVLAHNHPSGDPSPSAEDVAVTRMAVEAGRLLDIAVLDHLILGNPRWVSLKERGQGFDGKGKTVHEKAIHGGIHDDPSANQR